MPRQRGMVMGLSWRLLLEAGVGVVAVATAATATRASVVGGGGKASTDCLAVFDAGANDPAKKPRNVKCTDGDPACDTDGVINGVCEIPVAVCANSTAFSSCTLSGVESLTVDHALDNGDKNFDPELQALQTRIDNGIQPPTDETDLCTVATHFHVSIKGPVGKNKCQSNSKTIKVKTISKPLAGKVSTDTDTIKLTCVPSPDSGCDPQTLFTGTFDRIQHQILNQSCALSGCHDSQTKSGDLLLEIGAAYGALIDIVPSNTAAATAGWKRVTILNATTGDAESSFIYHKVTGDLPDASYGVSMPRGKPKIHSSLREVIRLWIESGAPDTGWVPGTF
jgi:hypothetical protein